jgi:hypothetical protein
MPKEFDLIFRPGIAVRPEQAAAFWERPEITHLFPDANLKELRLGLKPETYQSWLDCYYQRITEEFSGLKNALDLKILEAKTKFPSRPLWALTFSEKRFRDRDLPDTMIDQFLKDSKLGSSRFWRAEREAIMDNHNLPAVIERCVDAGGKVQRLAVLRVSDDGLGFSYRQENRFNRIEFATSGPKLIYDRLILWDLFRSDRPVLDDLNLHDMSFGWVH